MIAGGLQRGLSFRQTMKRIVNNKINMLMADSKKRGQNAHTYGFFWKLLKYKSIVRTTQRFYSGDFRK